MSARIKIKYLTSNRFKIEEARRVIALMRIETAVGVHAPLADNFEFAFDQGPTGDLMECNIAKMVAEKSKAAYSQLLVPCIVEYAGLIFEDLAAQNFPGGLTQSIWNALGPDRFVNECARPGRRALARAVVGYCDGKCVRAFEADVTGQICNAPLGTRSYDWDTIFCPDGEAGQTYSQIVEDPAKGLDHKVQISQSTNAMLKFFEFLHKSGQSDFFY